MQELSVDKVKLPLKGTNLTFNRVRKLGFSLKKIGSEFTHLLHKDGITSIFYCFTSVNGYKKGEWYFSDKFTDVDTVEELKSLYKLVTKKELEKI